MRILIFFTKNTTTKFLSLLLLVSCTIISACSDDEDVQGFKDPCNHGEVQEIFTVVEDMPRFPGCEDMGLSNEELFDCASGKMIEFLYENLEYPIEAFNNDILDC